MLQSLCINPNPFERATCSPSTARHNGMGVTLLPSPRGAGAGRGKLVRLGMARAPRLRSLRRWCAFNSNGCPLRLRRPSRSARNVPAVAEALSHWGAKKSQKEQKAFCLYHREASIVILQRWLCGYSRTSFLAYYPKYHSGACGCKMDTSKRKLTRQLSAKQKTERQFAR
jgi:hypothetical protein